MRAKQRSSRLPSTREGHAIVTAILDAASDLLADLGLAKMTTNRVAVLAGVSVGSLYQYFPNKEAIVAALSRRFDERALSAATEAIDAVRERTLFEITQALVRVLVAIARGEERARRALLREVPRSWTDDASSAAIDGRIEHAIEALIEAHEDEVRAGRKDVMSFIAYHASRSIVEAALVQRPELLSDERFVEELARLNLAYLGPSEK